MMIDPSTRKTENVLGAVWLATLILTYNEKVIKGSNDINFSQKEIQQLAQKLCTKTIHSPRISQWCNGDHPNNTYNYLRAVDKRRRLTKAGEFNGKNEYPDRLFGLDMVILEVGNKDVTYGELVEWYRNMYSKS